MRPRISTARCIFFWRPSRWDPHAPDETQIYMQFANFKHPTKGTQFCISCPRNSAAAASPRGSPQAGLGSRWGSRWRGGCLVALALPRAVSFSGACATATHEACLFTPRARIRVRNGESGGKIARCETRHPNRWFVGRRHSDLRLRGMAGVSYSHSLPMVVDGILSVDPASFAVRLRCCRSSIHMADRRFRASGAGAERARGSRRDRRNWFRSRFFRADGSRSRLASRAAVGHLRDRSAESSSWSRRRRRFLGEAALIRF